MNAPSMWLKVQPLVDKHCSHVAKKTKRFLRGTNERWGFNHQLAIDMAMSQPGCHWQSKSPLETAHGMVSPSCFSFSTSCNDRIPHDVTGSYLFGGLKMFETFFVFPYIGNNNPKWLIFFRGVETTNQRTLIWLFFCLLKDSSDGSSLHCASSRVPLDVPNATRELDSLPRMRSILQPC